MYSLQAGIWALWLRRTRGRKGGLRGRTGWRQFVAEWALKTHLRVQEENEASGSPGLWKLLVGWKPSYWWVRLISSASQKNAGKGITPERDVMQQTRLISYKPVLFVCGEVRRGMREIKWCFWGTPHFFLLQAGQLQGAFLQTWALLLPISPRLASSEAPPCPPWYPIKGKRWEMQ